jgi:hypothetical protein
MAHYTDTNALDPILNALIENDPDHYHLKKCGVMIAVLFFYGNDGAPLKSAGYPCAAKIKITGGEARALGQKDAILTVDAATWDDLDASARVALVDHELHHLEPVIEGWKYATEKKDGVTVNKVDASGNWIKESATYTYDDYHRPKLKMRLHDIQVGWFVRCVEKWGKEALERKQADAMADGFGNLLFDFEKSEREIERTQRRAESREMNLPAGGIEDWDPSDFIAELQDAIDDARAAR